MTRREIAALVCKSLAIFYLGWAVVLLSGYLGFALESLQAPEQIRLNFLAILSAIISISPMAAMVFVGWFLWAFADSMACRMVSDNDDPVTASPISIADITSIVFSACGIFVSLGGIQDVAAPVMTASYTGSGTEYIFWRSEFWVGIAKIIIGVWLLLGSRGIVGLIYRLRSFRTFDAADPSAADEPATDDSRHES